MLFFHTRQFHVKSVCVQSLEMDKRVQSYWKLVEGNQAHNSVEIVRSGQKWRFA